MLRQMHMLEVVLILGQKSKLCSKSIGTKNAGTGWPIVSSGETAAAGKSSPSVDNSSTSDLMNWAVPSTSINQRMRRIEEILDSIPYFFGSMLDDNDLQTQLLAEPGDAFLIACPEAKKEINPESSWYLVVLEPNEIVLKVKVVYLHKTLEIWSEKNTTLLQFIKKHSLKTIERPWNIRPEQISEKMAIIPQLAFPINDAIIPLGILSQKTLNFDSKRRIPVIELSVTECNAQEMKFLLAEAERRRRFGSVRIWRLWGICQHDTGAVSLILEDIIYGSVAEFVRTSQPLDQLCKFAVQIVEGLRHLEKYAFVHRRLAIDVCLLTYNYNVKIAIYGLTAGELFPKYDDFEDIDHCRWLPPECLPSADNGSGTSIAAYNTSGMIYSFGMILWSMFHGAALPFEDEPADNIRNRKYRIQNPPYIDQELVPRKVRDVILSCLSDDIAIRGRLKTIKIYLRQYCASLL